MRDGDRALRLAFRFDAADLAANRSGRLSPRQAALLRAGRLGMRLSLAVFAIVMLGTVGLVAFFNWRLETPGGPSSGVGVAAAVAGTVILIGWMLSRRHMAAARSHQLRVAHGPVDIVSDALDDCRIRVGAAVLRVPSVEQLEAFRPGTEYRVHYLEAPVPIVLSAESLSGGLETPDPVDEADERATAGDQVGVVRRGYVVVVLLGVLALGIPLAGVLVGDLPARLRPFAWMGLLAVAIGFVWLALAWLGAGKRRHP